MQAVISRKRRVLHAPAIRALDVLLLAAGLGHGAAAEERCYSWGMNSRFLIRDNIAVVMRIDGGLSDLRRHLAFTFPESELPLSPYLDEESAAAFRGANRFDHASEYLVLKTIKGELDQVIVLKGYAVNHRTHLGGLELIALNGLLPDGTYDYSSVRRAVLHEHFSVFRNAKLFGGPTGLRITCEPEY